MSEDYIATEAGLFTEKDYVIKRNLRARRLFDQFGIKVRLTGPGQKPNLIIDNGIFLSAYLHNFWIHFQDENDETYKSIKLNGDHLEVDQAELMKMILEPWNERGWYMMHENGLYAYEYGAKKHDGWKRRGPLIVWVEERYQAILYRHDTVLRYQEQEQNQNFNFVQYDPTKSRI